VTKEKAAENFCVAVEALDKALSQIKLEEAIAIYCEMNTPLVEDFIGYLNGSK
jgi:hypothetical protein